VLRARWLGRVGYQDALALQRAIQRFSSENYLLLLEHPHVYTMGLRARPEHVLASGAELGAELVRADRGGDVTYHGPGQLVAYPVLSVPGGHRAVPAYVASVEEVAIRALRRLGLSDVGRLPGYPGVWVAPGGPRPAKVCAVGVRVSRGRSMHGLALNVAPDLSRFGRIVPCGIADKGVTSLAEQGLHVPMDQVVDAVVEAAAAVWSSGRVERQDVSGHRPLPAGDGPAPSRLEARLAATGVDPSSCLPLRARKPPWLRAQARMGEAFFATKRALAQGRLVTVCEEAGCPNIFECWAEGTATFMINGDRCTRACGFCLVDTRRPLAPDPGEPERVAEAVARMGLAHAVVTAVARDDLADGGAAAFAATVQAIRRASPRTTVEVLIPDCKGDPAALETIFEARPDVLNHNLETVARLQRAVRPSASYARSLAVLGRAKAAGLWTKSGLMIGLGETADEVLAAFSDLRAVGVDVLTVGQYLRPSQAHLPVARWWTPEELEGLGRAARAMGFAHVVASPLARSSYHAREAARPPGPLPAARPAG
jgi:lipoic acid synthetase